MGQGRSRRGKERLRKGRTVEGGRLGEIGRRVEEGEGREDEGNEGKRMEGRYRKWKG